MIRRILVPLDGSVFGEHALPRAVALARRHGAVLDLAHVHEVASLVYLEGVPLIDATVELDGIQSDRSYLDRTVERVRAAGVDAKASLLDGPTVAALEGHIEGTDIDLVVMTTHGRGPLSRAWLGSIADGLARHTARPVLLIRPPAGIDDASKPRPDPGAAPAPLENVLIPLDGSADAESMIDHAIEVAGPDASFLLLHVVPPSLVVGGHVFKVEPARQQEFVEAARERLTPALRRLTAADRVAELDVVIADDVATSILEAAADRGSDLVALTTHGHGGLSRLVFGSVTDKVLRGASLPILVRRPG